LEKEEDDAQAGFGVTSSSWRRRKTMLLNWLAFFVLLQGSLCKFTGLCCNFLFFEDMFVNVSPMTSMKAVLGSF
jgi:hypothetical protein